MYKKILLNLFLIIIIAIFQLSFISGLPWQLNQLNLFLVILIFILSLSNFTTALWLMVGIGILFDIFSFTFFGGYLICLFLTALFANFLLINFFTNRSLYSFCALIFLSSLFYKLVLNLIIIIFNFFHHQQEFFMFVQQFWSGLIAQLILNLSCGILLFYIIYYSTNRLKLAFLHSAKTT